MAGRRQLVLHADRRLRGHLDYPKAQTLAAPDNCRSRSKTATQVRELQPILPQSTRPERTPLARSPRSWPEWPPAPTTSTTSTSSAQVGCHDCSTRSSRTAARHRAAGDVDIDSLLRPVFGHAKQGASFGHTKIAGKQVLRRGLSPLVTTISTRSGAPVVSGLPPTARRGQSSFHGYVQLAYSVRLSHGPRVRRIDPSQTELRPRHAPTALELTRRVDLRRETGPVSPWDRSTDRLAVSSPIGLGVLPREVANAGDT